MKDTSWEVDPEFRHEKPGVSPVSLQKNVHVRHNCRAGPAKNLVARPYIAARTSVPSSQMPSRGEIPSIGDVEAKIIPTRRYSQLRRQLPRAGSRHKPKKTLRMRLRSPKRFGSSCRRTRKRYTERITCHPAPRSLLEAVAAHFQSRDHGHQ